MPSAIYVDAAAQSALARRIDSIASNVANAATVGYRADGIKFDSVLSTTGGSRVSFPVAGRDYISTAGGSLLRTQNPLDCAVRGAGWFSLMSPDGPVYTRDGRFQLAASGALQSVNGYEVLDASGAPITLDPSAGEVAIAGDGVIAQQGRRSGAIGLFTIDPDSRLARYDNSSVTSSIPASPILEFTTNGVAQGYVEQSNVDPIRELTRLIEIQRAFDNVTSTMEIKDAAQQEAIKTLGSPA